MRFKLSLLICMCFFCGNIFSAANQFVIVIDPGHGGKDPGALRGKIREKDITLAVSLLLGKLIENNHKDVKVIYTRKTDETLILADRAKKANTAKANLFFSIHVNSSKAKETTANGAETYIMGIPKNAEDQAVAVFENSVILQEDNYESRYEGFDPNSTEFHILSEFMYNRYRDQSIELASNIQSGLKSKASRYDRGVKENFFLVLRTATMPSVLIEMGFINNKSEAQYLTSQAGQKQVAESIYQGFRKYKLEFDKRQTGTTKIYKAKKSELDIEVKKKPDAVAVVSVSEPDIETTVKQALANTVVGDSTLIVSIDSAMKVVEKQASKTVEPKTVEPNMLSIAPAKPAIEANAIEYRIQFMLSTVALPPNSTKFRDLSPTTYYKDSDGLYKYTFGSTTDANEVNRLMRQVKKKFPDAFIVRFKDGKRIK